MVGGTAVSGVQAFLAGMRDRGYVVGQNLVVDVRYADGDRRTWPGLADELIALKPDVLVGIQFTAIVMKTKTSTIPIVLLISDDPVSVGLVKELARPGTNVTGMSGQLTRIVAKQVELLAEIVPKMSRLALVTEPWVSPKDGPYAGPTDPWARAMEPALNAMGLTLSVVYANDSDSLKEGFARLKRERPDGLVVAQNAVVTRLAPEIVDGARRLRLPAIAGFAAFVEAGGLLSYGVNFSENNRYAAKFVDRILKGAKPAELPVEQVSSYELLINQKTAREFGLKIPDSLLVRANRVIE